MPKAGRRRLIMPVAFETDEQTREFVQMCKKLDPNEVMALLGLGIIVGSDHEAATRTAAVTEVVKDLIGRGNHVEAASVAVANSLRKLALAAIRDGVEHHGGASEADEVVRRRLYELAAEAELLPSRAK